MKVLAWIIIAGVAGVLSVQIYSLYSERLALEKEAEIATAKLETQETEAEKLEAEKIYYGDIQNLSKELKSLFNYKKPNEHMLIVVPEKDN